MRVRMVQESKLAEKQKDKEFVLELIKRKGRN